MGGGMGDTVDEIMELDRGSGCATASTNRHQIKHFKTANFTVCTPTITKEKPQKSHSCQSNCHTSYNSTLIPEAPTLEEHVCEKLASLQKV